MNEEEKAEEVVTPAVTEDPLKTELDKVQGQKRTKEEKLVYTYNRVKQQVKDAGLLEEDEPEDEDDKTVTVGMLKKIQSESATKTALQLAEDTESETERELLKYHLENTIRSTGDPNKDFQLAQSLVNSIKNSQMIEEALRKPAVKSSTGGGAPAKQVKHEEFTEQELSFMKPPFNLTKEDVLKARPK